MKEAEAEEAKALEAEALKDAEAEEARALQAEALEAAEAEEAKALEAEALKEAEADEEVNAANAEEVQPDPLEGSSNNGALAAEAIVEAEEVKEEKVKEEEVRKLLWFRLDYPCCQRRWRRLDISHLGAEECPPSLPLPVRHCVCCLRSARTRQQTRRQAAGTCRRSWWDTLTTWWMQSTTTCLQRPLPLPRTPTEGA